MLPAEQRQSWTRPGKAYADEGRGQCARLNRARERTCARGPRTGLDESKGVASKIHGDAPLGEQAHAGTSL